MSSLLTIEIDATAVLAAIDKLLAAGQASVVERHCKEASRVTAQRIQREARARARRRTGTMAEHITVSEGSEPLGGFHVNVAPMPEPTGRYGRGLRPENFPVWHEFGTKFMTAQPFMFNSAQLESAAHERRIAEAVQASIDEVGLG